MDFRQKQNIAIAHLADELASVQSTLEQVLVKVEAKGNSVDDDDKAVIRQQHQRINLVSNALRNFVNQAR